jgi:uncharacterized protein YeaC (DUF1315 family)
LGKWTFTPDNKCVFYVYVSKSALSRQQNEDFADVTVIFSLPHQQKSQYRRVKQNCQHCKWTFSEKKKYYKSKAKRTYIVER